MIDGTQIRASRALLILTQVELADMCKISYSSLRRIETIENNNPNYNTLNKIEVVLKNKGIKFINKNNQIGIILKK